MELLDPHIRDPIALYITILVALVVMSFLMSSESPRRPDVDREGKATDQKPPQLAEDEPSSRA